MLGDTQKSIMMVRAMMMPTSISMTVNSTNVNMMVMMMMMVKSTNVHTTEVDSLPNSHLEISAMIDD